MPKTVSITTLMFLVLLLAACDNFEPEISELSDDTYRLRVKADDDGSGKQFVQALHSVGTDVCNGEFEPVSAVELDTGIPILNNPAMVVDIKCGPSDFPDGLLKSANIAAE